MNTPLLSLAALFAAVHFVPTALAQTAAPITGVLFENVRIFDGTSEHLSGPSHVLVVGNVIQTVSAEAIVPAADMRVTRIAGNGRTLMPGLIDVHTHLMFETLTQEAVLTADLAFVTAVATKGARDMLLRGFTSVRDVGGPVLGLKRAIDQGYVDGPRVWPSGAMISQSGGHGDFRLPTELPAAPGSFSFAERIGATAIVDGADAVRQRAREQLALGASQLKLMAGGGVGSHYDPLDVTQFGPDEMRAAVEAAENWGTYVTVHAYTPRAVRQAIAAGVKCIEHGQLLDEDTAKLMAEKGIWWSLQPMLDDRPSAFPERSPRRLKQLQVLRGTEAAYALAKKFKIKTAWGTDVLYSPENAAGQGRMLSKLVRWYTAAQALRMATADNAELLALAGARSPYPGKLGVVQSGALADLLLIDGDPLANLALIDEPAKNLLVIMKDGVLVKNLLP